MITKRFLIFILTICILTSCRKGYKVENEKVYFESWNESHGHNKFLIDSADSKTFKEIKFDCDCDFKFGRDKRHLFIDGELIKNIDPNTFRFLGNYVFRDKDSAYFFGFYTAINDCAIKGVNPDKLKLITYPWARADNVLINGFDTLLIDDINDFVPIDENWGKTKKYVINGIINSLTILKNAEPETFQIINSFSGKDRKHTYEFGKIKR